MALSSCDTMYHDGIVFHAAWSSVAPNTVPMIGFCVAAATRVSATGTSAAKSSWNFAGVDVEKTGLVGSESGAELRGIALAERADRLAGPGPARRALDRLLPA